tara:strand:- start:731 stop:1147 length:417 start_codon:yes stop_codon:yes gene_type:complete
MTNKAYQEIKDTYDYDTFKEIASHGCQSGVCHEHIYYGDTNSFFEKYPKEITSYIKDQLGVEVLSDTLKYNDGNLTLWMNDLTWTFIELVAMDVVDHNDEEYVPDYTLADSITEEAVKLNQGYNPPASMTDERYAHAG